MPTFHVTAKTSRDVTDAEVTRLPGWTRNPEQAHYIQAYDLPAETIGAAADTVDRALRAAGPGLSSVTILVRIVEPAGPASSAPPTASPAARASP